VPYACNPSYSEGRDQEGHGSKPAQTNSETSLKIPNTKRAGRVAQCIGPELKPQYSQKKKGTELIDIKKHG
jgi:hypothetical protein